MVKSRSMQAGLSLVELMIAMVIQLLLLMGLVHIYSNSKTLFRTSEQLSRIQEEGRFCVDVLSSDIRMAGYAGCLRLGANSPSGDPLINVIAKDVDAFSDIGDAIVGYSGGSGWTMPTPESGVKPDYYAGTDVITVRGAYGSGAYVNEKAVENANIKIASNPDDIAQGDLVLVSDCNGADLFTNQSNSALTLSHPNSVNTDNRLSKVYDTDAQIYRFDEKTFFIGQEDGKEPSLYVYSLNSGSYMRLASGVADMAISYGVDSDEDGVVDKYSEAKDMSAVDWERAVGVRLGLLLQSDDSITTEAAKFTFDGVDVNTDKDRRMRKAFWSYVALRNRIKLQ